MAEAIKKTYGVKPEFIEGSGGIFDVTANGELVFSKDQVGRFPEHEEVLSKLDALAKA